MDINDLRIDTFTNSSPVVNMKITHLPTGITVIGESKHGQWRLRKRLIKELGRKVNFNSGT